MLFWSCVIVGKTTLSRLKPRPFSHSNHIDDPSRRIFSYRILGLRKHETNLNVVFLKRKQYHIKIFNVIETPRKYTITNREKHLRKASGTSYLLLRSPSKDRSTTTWTNRGGGRVSKTSSLVHLLPTLTNGGIKMSMPVLSRGEGVKFGSNFVYVVVEWPPKAWIL